MPPSRNVLIYLEWSDPSLWHGLRAYAREAGWLLVAPERPSKPPKASREFDGAIVLVTEDKAFDTRKRFPGAKIVDIRDTAGLASDGIVVVDHEKVGRLAADYLHGLGYRSFIGLDQIKPWRGIRERVLAYRRRLGELGVRMECLHYDGWAEHAFGRPRNLKAKVGKILSRCPKPVAVFSPNAHVADLFLQTTLHLGYRVPDDVAVLGADNDRGFCEMSRVPLSSIDVHLSKLGYEAARLLNRLMAGGGENKRAPTRITIPPLGVDKRRSTERTGSDDKVVGAILGYIRDHFMEKITAEHIIHDIHASRTNAFLRFRKATGRSIGEEIERVRIGHARTLLAETDYKVDAVARLSGYANTSAFCRTFKKATGKTPSEFRIESDRTA